MKSLLRMLSASLFLVASPAMASNFKNTKPVTKPAPAARSAADTSADEAVKTSYAPLVVLGVLAVGAVVVALAASGSYPSTAGGRSSR